MPTITLANDTPIGEINEIVNKIPKEYLLEVDVSDSNYFDYDKLVNILSKW